VFITYIHPYSYISLDIYSNVKMHHHTICKPVNGIDKLQSNSKVKDLKVNHTYYVQYVVLLCSVTECDTVGDQRVASPDGVLPEHGGRVGPVRMAVEQSSGVSLLPVWGRSRTTITHLATQCLQTGQSLTLASV
jgi:hypothetical protein